MQPEAQLLFYLAAVISLVYASIGNPRRSRARTRNGSDIDPLPLGIALALIPTLWRVAETAL